jgi:hypothetical protein
MRAISLFVGMVILAATTARAEDSKLPSDEEISRKIVGKWTMEKMEKGGTIKGFSDYKKDGTFETMEKVAFDGKTLESANSGTWKVEKGVLLSSITKTNGTASKFPRTEKNTILAFSDKEMKLKAQYGKGDDTWKREKE